MNQSIVESIATYACEDWELNKRNKNWLMALEMDFWRCSVSKLEHITITKIRQGSRRQYY